MRTVRDEMRDFTPSGGGGATSGKGTTGDIQGSGKNRGQVGGGVLSRKPKPKARGGRAVVKKPLPPIVG
jgi:hypothetical protein